MMDDEQTLLDEQTIVDSINALPTNLSGGDRLYACADGTIAVDGVYAYAGSLGRHFANMCNGTHNRVAVICALHTLVSDMHKLAVRCYLKLDVAYPTNIPNPNQKSTTRYRGYLQAIKCGIPLVRSIIYHTKAAYADDENIHSSLDSLSSDVDNVMKQIAPVDD